MTAEPTVEDDGGEAPAPRQALLVERTITSSDGLSLHASDYGDPGSPWTPVVCLPGLTRSHRDFTALATHLANHRHRPRRVICVDYRGRGLSEWDERIENYNPVTEMHDVYAVMAALDIPRATIVGTSRGGIIGMFMGNDRPHCVAGLVLVDIGPVIEPLGLARIKSYVGRMPQPDDWADAAALLKRLHGGHFTAWGEAEWDRYARLTFRDDNGTPGAAYDPRLAETFEGVEFDQPIPDLWAEFNALANVPVLVVHGENSDLLSAETVAAMAAAHPDLATWTVPGEGHPPFLDGGPLLNRISSFITGHEGHEPAKAPQSEVQHGKADH
ncbi:MAG: alpha/beta fold hydrolase [Alphaproteobacteria bacterium]